MSFYAENVEKKPESGLSLFFYYIKRFIWGPRTVTHLVCKIQENEIFNSSVSKVKKASKKNFNDLMQSGNYCPIQIEKISNIKDSEKLSYKDIVFVKIEEICSLNLNSKDLKKAVEKNCLSSFTRLPEYDQKIIEVRRSLVKKIKKGYYTEERRKETLIEKWSKPIKIEVINKAESYFKKQKKVQLTIEQRDSLLEGRTSGSNTIGENSIKRNDWKNAEQYIFEKAANQEDLTLEDLYSINKSIHGEDNEEIGGGKLREIPVCVISGRNGYLYLGHKDIESLLVEVLKYMQESISNEENPIIVAAAVYQKMVSIHPFADGNGRTCRLVMDYILIRAGLIPPSLDNNELKVAIFGEQEVTDIGHTIEEETPTTAVEKVLSGIKKSYAKLEIE